VNEVQLVLESIVAWFQSGGPWMYLVVLSDVVGMPCVALSLLVAATSRVTKKGVLFARVVAWSVVLGALLPMLAGAAGAGAGLYMLEKAASVAAPDMVDELRVRGTQIALIPLKFGGWSSLLFLLPALLSVAIVPSRAELAAAGLFD